MKPVKHSILETFSPHKNRVIVQLGFEIPVEGTLNPTDKLSLIKQHKPICDGLVDKS